MAFPIRSLDDLSRLVRGSVRQYLPGTDASLKQNVLTVIAKVVALLAHEYELRLAWIFRQLFLSTATSMPMVRMHAAEFGVLQKPSSPASGLVVGTAAPHEAYPAGVRFLSGASTFVTSDPFTANAIGEFEAKVVAERSGLDTNRDAGAELLLADAVLYPAMSDRVVVGIGGLGGGADVETIEQLRTRALKRKSAPAQGGSLVDYEGWALEVPGVVKAWAANFSNGFGTVGCWILVEGRAYGIPTPADLDLVDAHIVDKRLVRARFYAAAPVAVPVDLSIRLSPDTAANRAAVTASLATLFDATKPAGARVRPGLPDDPFLLLRSWISEVISTTEGEDGHSLVEPAFDLTFDPGELPVLGDITWL
ncbi:baseplate J/gp47 family protein [Mesorhizobium sp. CAU 1732]|uniref:baseplate J/gp47 family protein n=1 Tax=Mesorhizobium sp. CAU 1732 TaxID=3140358 RepID=UPI003261A3FE